MDAESHLRNAEAYRTEIFRRMTPTQRLALGVRMNRQMRALMDAGLKAQHPEWTAEQRRRVIAERILYARTG
jgi:hypothetical protein